MLFWRGLRNLAEASNSHPFIDSGFDFQHRSRKTTSGALGLITAGILSGLLYVGDGPQEPPAHGVISVLYEPGLNLVKRLFHKSDVGAQRQLFDGISDAVRSKGAIRIVPQPPYDE